MFLLYFTYSLIPISSLIPLVSLQYSSVTVPSLRLRDKYDPQVSKVCRPL